MLSDKQSIIVKRAECKLNFKNVNAYLLMCEQLIGPQNSIIKNLKKTGIAVQYQRMYLKYVDTAFNDRSLI